MYQRTRGFVNLLLSTDAFRFSDGEKNPARRDWGANHEPKLNRLRRELLLIDADADREGAKRCFRKAIDIARRQNAQSWELRATTSLARLLLHTGRREGGVILPHAESDYVQSAKASAILQSVCLDWISWSVALHNL